MSEVEPLAPGRRDAITDVRGVRVGHWTSRRRATGCTVILCEDCTAAAVDVRGGAPATHETEALAGQNAIRRCHAVVLTGGSAFGLASTAGVARWLAGRGVGVETTGGPVPIVVGAGIYDLHTGPNSPPGAEEGERAAARATGGAVAQGSVGAGTGATVAKLLGVEQGLKGGVGTASLVGPRGLVVGALAITNAVGAIVEPATGELVAGPRGEEPGEMRTPEQAVVERKAEESPRENTTLVCIATNADIEHIGVQRLAVHGHDGAGTLDRSGAHARGRRHGLRADDGGGRDGTARPHDAGADGNASGRAGGGAKRRTGGGAGGGAVGGGVARGLGHRIHDPAFQRVAPIRYPIVRLTGRPRRLHRAEHRVQ